MRKAARVLLALLLIAAALIGWSLQLWALFLPLAVYLWAIAYRTRAWSVHS